MTSPRRELERRGRTALEQLRGPVLTGIQQKLAAWRDPRARLLRRRRRAKRTTAGGAVATGAFGGGAFVAYSPETAGIAAAPGFSEFLLDTAGFGLGALTLAAGAGTVGAALRHRRLKKTPLPEPAPAPVALPPEDSRAHAPMRNLRDAEQSMYAVLGQLKRSGKVDDDPVDESRATAANAAASLRAVADRLQAVEAVVPHVPDAERAGLRAEVDHMAVELDEGLEGYRGLVAAAGRAVAANAPGDQRQLVREATDRLAGLALALRELSGGGEADSSSASPDL